jgi:hypothetical protein
MNHTLVVDNFLTSDQCDFFIEKIHKNDNIIFGAPQNYELYATTDDDMRDFSNKFNCNLLTRIVQMYVKNFPEINMSTDSWEISRFNVKRFKPGNFFEGWHSEHYKGEQRVACALIYLSDHNCGTEFYSGETVLSKKGRILIFPTYWTHTHRGQLCPDNKERYIMSSYFNVT